MESHCLHVSYSEVAIPELLLTDVGKYCYKCVNEPQTIEFLEGIF